MIGNILYIIYQSWDVGMLAKKTNIIIIPID